jgi:uncharacterized membrane protein (UPF0127 family)
MLPRLSLLLLAVALTGVLAGCGGDSGESRTEPERTIPFDEEGEMAFLQEGDTVVTVQIEIAETDSARERGMMQREGFPDETSAMLFPFNRERERSFWMANTPVALDIFFVSADSQIVSIAKYTTPYSDEQIRSGDPAKYVVETPAGFADSHGLLEGDRVRWRRTD